MAVNVKISGQSEMCEPLNDEVSDDCGMRAVDKRNTRGRWKIIDLQWILFWIIKDNLTLR